MSEARDGISVRKVGGSALADGRDLDRLASALADPRRPTVVVLSALRGITDALLEAHRLHAEGADELPDAVEDLVGRHRLALPSPAAAPPRFRALVTRLRDLLAPCAPSDAAARDALLALGEELAVELLVARMPERIRPLDAAEWLPTDGPPGEARPRLPEAAESLRQRCEEALGQGLVVALTGFIGRDARSGRTTTLGRGGTDQTAVLVAEALGARSLTLWRAVSGVHDADPLLVPQARPVSALPAPMTELLVRRTTHLVQAAAWQRARASRIEVHLARLGEAAPATILHRENPPPASWPTIIVHDRALLLPPDAPEAVVVLDQRDGKGRALALEGPALRDRYPKAQRLRWVSVVGPHLPDAPPSDRGISSARGPHTLDLAWPIAGEASGALAEALAALHRTLPAR